MTRSDPLFDALASAAKPLVNATESVDQFLFLLAELGWDFPVASITAEDIPIIGQLAPIAQQLFELAPATSNDSDDLDDPDDDGTGAAALVATIVELAQSLIDVLADVAANPPTSSALPTEMLTADFWIELAAELPEYLLIRWLDDLHPIPSATLRLLGVITVGPGVRGRERKRVNLASLGALVSDPNHLITHYLWGQPGFRYDELHAALVDFAAAIGLDVRIDAALTGGKSIRVPMAQQSTGMGLSSVEAGLLIRPAMDPSDSPDGVALGVYSLGSVSANLELADALWLSATASGVAEGAVEVRSTGLSIDVPAAAIAFGATIAFTPDGGMQLLGRPGGSGLSIGGAAINVGVNATNSGLELEISAGLVGNGRSGLELVVAGGDGDSFLSSIMGDVSIAAGIDLDVGWSTSGGLIINFDSSLEVVIPLSIQIGPILLSEIAIGIGVPEAPGSLVQVDASSVVSGQLGPLSLAVAGLGFSAVVSDQVGQGKTADLRLAAGFKPPTGIALGLDLGVVKGGGGLFIDVPAGKYEGVLQLEVMSVGISAFVIIETKRPDIDGWSMMMALYIEIPAIQLGFGFTLSGVGGLAGINRGIDPEALGDAVRSGSLDTMLFPDNPIADAPIIIDTLAAIFPAADGQYVFGPVVKIGWGTPTLVEISVGVVIELPDPIRIAILGSVSALLPRPEAPLVELHLDVAGVLDFEAGTIAIDASLHHSTIVGFSLAGDMSLRAGFKDDPTFLFSLGGFHPAFEPPAGFPALRRLSIGMNAGPVFRVSFECYIAITSNTIQFGTAFEIVARIAGFGIEGGFEFDALIQFNPFKLQVSLGMHISVTALGVDLMGVWLHGQVEGPNPWHITGFAEFRALGVKKEVNVDETIGSRANELEPPPPGLLDRVVEALNLPGAWAAGASTSDGVALAVPQGSDDAVLVGPHGTLEVGQNIVPLAQTIEKFGNSENIAHIRFELVAGSEFGEPGTIRDWFSPGHYTRLQERERLAAPSFEQMIAGIVLGGAAVAGPPRATALGHEPILVDSDYEAWEAVHRPPPRPSLRIERAGIIDTSAFATATLADGVAFVEQPGSFGVQQPAYVVTDELTGDVLSPAGTFLAASINQQPGRIIALVGEDA